MEYIKSKDNHIIKMVAKLIKNRKTRYENNLFVIEGLKQTVEALKSNCKINAIIMTTSIREKNQSIINESIEKNIKLYIIDNDIMPKISDTVNPQGIVCICQFVDTKLSQINLENNGLIIALDSLNDPNNVGTIIRTADAMGIKALIVTENNADIYNPKTLRGTMGSIFRTPLILTKNLAEELGKLHKYGFVSCAATLDESSKKLANFNFPLKSAVIIGNESHGISNEILDVSMEKITINMKGKTESLNASVAASILMWEYFKSNL